MHFRLQIIKNNYRGFITVLMWKNQIHIINSAWKLAFLEGIFLQIIAWELMKPPHEHQAQKWRIWK